MAKVDNLETYQLPALHSAVSAGEPLNRQVFDQFEKYFDVTVRDGYGQTENTLLLGFLKGMKVKPGSMGKPTPGNDVQLIDEDCNPVAMGEVDRKSTRLNSSHVAISYAVFCLKKKRRKHSTRTEDDKQRD